MAGFTRKSIKTMMMRQLHRLQSLSLRQLRHHLQRRKEETNQGRERSLEGRSRVRAEMLISSVIGRSCFALWRCVCPSITPGASLSVPGAGVAVCSLFAKGCHDGGYLCNEIIHGALLCDDLLWLDRRLQSRGSMDIFLDISR